MQEARRNLLFVEFANKRLLIQNLACGKKKKNWSALVTGYNICFMTFGLRSHLKFHFFGMAYPPPPPPPPRNPGPILVGVKALLKFSTLKILHQFHAR